MLEAIFHNSSFGYRPGRSAHGALSQCQGNCIKHAWVVDVDIKGFFDSISHSIMMQLLQKHTQEKWVLMYVERWLKAGVEQPGGSIAARQQGTPQGGVISPLLANLYLHHAFDEWMDEGNPQCPFERYADDIVIHCSTKEGAEKLLERLGRRMQEYLLTLHPEKTKIVYCKNYKRTERHENESFTFLSYSYEPREKEDKSGRSYRTYMIFAPDICSKAQAGIREALRETLIPRWTDCTMEAFAARLNPKIRGWVNYYTRFYKATTLRIFHYLNELIRAWIRNKYRLKTKTAVYAKYNALLEEQPELFYHWKVGITV
jgi:group II intron reverse transcriptase/maturase